MWTETMMKNCVEKRLDFVFGERVAVLDLDTYNTPAGRVDAVLLNEKKQLIIVEFERWLDLKNIEHALIDQAYACARYWYMKARQADIGRMYHYYRRYRFPTEKQLPDLRHQLGMDETESELWDRQQKCVVVAAGWKVRPSVYQEAERLMRLLTTAEKDRIPCEVWIYEIEGEEDSGGNVQIKDCRRKCVFESSGFGVQAVDGPGLPEPNQHVPARLSEEFQNVLQLLPDYLSYELKRDFEFYSKARWRNSIVKLCPWGAEAGMCFEFGRMDSKNPIKGPCCQLYICQRRELGARLRKHLQDHWSEIAEELGCLEEDLAWQSFAYPIKQHRIPGTTPEEVAYALGNFSSVVYRWVNPIIRAALEAR